MSPVRRSVAAALAFATAVSGVSVAHANTTNTVDTVDDVGVWSDIAIAPDGYPVIAYHDETGGNLKLFDCDNADCSSGTATTVETTNNVGLFPSIVIGPDGYPIIAHYDSSLKDLRVFDCSNATCSSGSAKTVDIGVDAGIQPSMVLGADGNPIIAFYDETNESLQLADCSTPDCSANVQNTLDGANDAGFGSAIVLGNDGAPIISYAAANGDVRVYDCDNTACSSGTSNDIDTGITFFLTRTSMVLGTDGNPIVAYTNIASAESMVYDCDDTACSSGTETKIPNALTSTIVLGVDGYPIVLFAAGVAEPLRVFKCDDTTCANGDTKIVSETGSTGVFPAMTLGMDYSPVISFHDGDELAVADCSTPTCGPRQIDRVFGPTRVETAIQVSQNAFGAGGAQAVVIARADLYPDALVGGPLAAVVTGPLLLTPSDALPAAVLAEIGRILPPGGTIHVLGGTAAVDSVVTDALDAAGYVVVRYAGTDRFDTATRVANAIGALGGGTAAALLASGTNFPDALAASAAGAWNFDPVLLTNDDQPAAATTGWIAANTPGDVVCVGGPACSAYPAASVKLVGVNRYETAALVGEFAFEPTSPVGVASGEAFPDALVAAADTLNRGGPLLLTRSDKLSDPTKQFLDMWSPVDVTIYGGPAALSPAVEAALAN